MKKTILLILSVLLLLGVIGCATMKQATNIHADSEFIPCDDASCDICHGEGQFDCASCGPSGQVTCTTCDGNGDVPCDGNILTNALNVTCVGGYSRVNDWETNTDASMDDQGFLVDVGTGERLECAACEGRGVEECRTCDGSGEVDCSDCSGYGYLLHGTTVNFSTCSNCGERLDAGATQCTSCGLNAVVYQCKECDALFNEELESCPECGAGA